MQVFNAQNSVFVKLFGNLYNSEPPKFGGSVFLYYFCTEFEKQHICKATNSYN